MDDHTRTNITSASGGSGIGFIVAAIIVVLILLYALFAGGGASTTVDPATVGTGADTAPIVEESTPAQPVAPALDN